METDWIWPVYKLPSQFVESDDFLFKDNFLPITCIQSTSFHCPFKQVDSPIAGCHPMGLEAEEARVTQIRGAPCKSATCSTETSIRAVCPFSTAAVMKSWACHGANLLLK